VKLVHVEDDASATLTLLLVALTRRSHQAGGVRNRPRIESRTSNANQKSWAYRGRDGSGQKPGAKPCACSRRCS
jgi:hypothetical protein